MGQNCSCAEKQESRHGTEEHEGTQAHYANRPVRFYGHTISCLQLESAISTANIITDKTHKNRRRAGIAISLYLSMCKSVFF